MNVKFHKIMGSWQNYIFHMKFSEYYLCFHNSCEIWHLFSRTPMKNFLWCYYRWLITSLALEKCKKECNILAIFFKSFWTRFFVHWKLKLLNFLVDSVLIFLFSYQTNILSVRFKAQEREKVSVIPDFRTNASIGIILHKHHLMPARTMSIFEYSTFRTFVLTYKYTRHC